MVQSAAETVDAYMATVDAPRREAMERLRAACHEHLTGWSETMRWGMPGFGPEGGDPVVSFNAQKRHIALYAGKAAIESVGDRLATRGVDCGKGCVRYSGPAAMDFDVIADMLKHIRAHKAEPC